MMTGPPHPQIRTNETSFSTGVPDPICGAPSSIPEIAASTAPTPSTGVKLFDDDKPSLLPSKGIALISGEHSPDLPCLRSMQVNRCASHITHWVSLCNNGMVPILEGHLRTGGSIALFSACENTKTARTILQHRLNRLHDQFPDKFPPSAFIGWDSRLPHSLSLIRSQHWDAIPSVYFLDAGPCSLLPTSSARDDTSSIRPSPLQDILCNIRFLHDSQQSTLTYIVSSMTSSLDLPMS
jgi:hypothetical protein